MGASEAPEKEEETRDSEAEADLATGTEHVAPGEEVPVEEANPEDGVHEVCIASQTSANIMKQAQDDDGRQADDELGRIAATAHEAADEEAAPCSEFDSANAGVADITAPAEATGGQAARSNAQETAAVRLVRTPAQRADYTALQMPPIFEEALLPKARLFQAPEPPGAERDGGARVEPVERGRREITGVVTRARRARRAARPVPQPAAPGCAWSCFFCCVD